MKVLMVASENSPFAQTGGLSQVVSYLSRAEGYIGLDTRVFIPKYGVIDEKKFELQMNTENLAVPTGHGKNTEYPEFLYCNVKFKDQDEFIAATYFLENREYYELRANVYGYSDEHIRFALLSYGCLEWILQSKAKNEWVPDIIHAHDWHTGYLIEAIKRNPRYKKALADIKVLYTIHNFKHQGNSNFRYSDEPDNGKEALKPMFDEGMRKQNPMLRGIINADKVNTVSHKHAQEVQTKEYGEGLDKYLRKYSAKLSGIANGIDTLQMSPETDKHIVAKYNSESLQGRKVNKADLQKHFNLPVEENIPVIAYIGRLAPQKGIEVILKTIEHIDDLPPCQFIFLGSGAENYYTEIKSLTENYPNQVAAHLKGDFLIPRKIFSGGDMLLVPSVFEPGGIVAMEALRYGCVPIVADTGGLSETVEHFNIRTMEGNGFLHQPKNFWSFFIAFISALQVYQDKSIWQQIVKNGMVSDFSWDKTASLYKKLYEQL